MTINLRQRLLCIFAAAGLTMAAGCQSGIGRYMPDISMPKALARKNGHNSHEQQPSISTPRVTDRNYAQVQLAMGDSLAKEKNFDAAQAAYEAAIRNDDTLARAYHRLALMGEKTGKGSDAKDLFQQAIKLDPKNAEIACDYGYWCYLRQDWNEAQKQFERALKLDPNLKRARNNLGLVFARTGRPDDALNQFASAGLSPADSRANLGFVYLTEKRFPEAKVELELAATGSSSSKKAQDILARFDKIESNAQAEPSQSVAAVPPPARTTIKSQFDIDPFPAADAPRTAVAETPSRAIAETQPRVAMVTQTAAEQTSERPTTTPDLPTQQSAPVLYDYQF